MLKTPKCIPPVLTLPQMPRLYMQLLTQHVYFNVNIPTTDLRSPHSTCSFSILADRHPSECLAQKTGIIFTFFPFLHNSHKSVWTFCGLSECIQNPHFYCPHPGVRYHFPRVDWWNSLHYSAVSTIFVNISHSMSLYYSISCSRSSSLRAQPQSSQGPLRPNIISVFTTSLWPCHRLPLPWFRPLQTKCFPYPPSNMHADSGLRSLPFRRTWDGPEMHFFPASAMVNPLSILLRFQGTLIENANLPPLFPILSALLLVTALTSDKSYLPMFLTCSPQSKRS